MKDDKGYTLVHFADIPGVACPCGTSRRAYIEESDREVSFHVVEIKIDAAIHYHKEHAEIYYILEGEGALELNGELVPVKAGDSCLIRPGCRHRAVGKLKVANVSLPAFDPADEYFD